MQSPGLAVWLQCGVLDERILDIGVGPISIPGYAIERELGVGGMARVYLAIQTSLERRVALKVMAPALAADASFSKRFMREARTIASLTHPNIVSVYEVGVTVDHLHYFSMQFLPGGDFAQRMRKQVSQAEIVRVLTGIAKALGFAHQQGVIHRDVTPGNIMFDSADTPQLTDFGIARALSGSTRITSTGVSIGTSNYMSPEQARGGEVDNRSDLYSLGALAFEALTGHTPYQGPDGFAVAYAHVFEPIPRLPPHLKQWQAFIDKALAKEPKDRFADGEDLINGLHMLTIPSDSTALEPVGEITAPPPKSTTKLIENLARQIGSAAPRVESAPVPWGRFVLIGVLLGGMGLVAYGVLAPKKPGLAASPVQVSADPAVPPPVPLESTTTSVAVAPPLAPSGTDGNVVAATGTNTVPPGDSTANLSGLPLSNLPVLGADGLPVTDATALPTDGSAVATVPVIDLSSVPPQSWGPPTLAAQVQMLFDLGQTYLRTQRLQSPADANATLIYSRLLVLDPKSEPAKKGLEAVVDAYLKLADLDLDAGRIAEGKALLDKARMGAKQPGLDNAGLTARVDLAWTRRAQTPREAARKALAAWQGDAALAAIDEALAFAPDDKELKAWQREAKLIGKPGYIFRDGAGNPELIIVGPGTATLSGTKRGDARANISKSFAVARREVSVGEFRRFADASGLGARGGCKNEDGGFFSGAKKDWSWRSPGFTQSADHPVVCVGYNDAAAYAAWLAKTSGKRYRLMSEAEWQYLAAKVKVAPCASGNRADASYQKKEGGNDAQNCDDGFVQTAPGGRFAASAGAYDFEGNVREWVADCGNDAHAGRTADQAARTTGNCGKRMVMGSAWHSDRDEPAVIGRRIENRDWMSNVVGFRIARDLDASAPDAP